MYKAGAQPESKPDFSWGNTSYYNLNVGDSINFKGVSVELLGIKNHCNTLRVDKDTLELKVTRRNLPNALGGLNVFVADNVNVKKLAENKDTHGLLTKDALICLSGLGEPLLDPNNFLFPVTFNHGFIWNGEEDSYLFSFTKNTEDGKYYSYPGIGISLNNARGQQKHWIAAIEDCSVEWIEDEKSGNASCVLLASSTQQDIFYVYDRLYKKNLEIRKGQKLQKGEIIGTAWGDGEWCYLQLSVIHSDTVPAYENRYSNVLNFFPQLYELYYKHAFSVSRNFSKGKIEFGRVPVFNENVQNASGFEDYLGKGWLFDGWNTANKLEWVAKGENGNVRMSRILFKNTSAETTNPQLFYEYVVNVKNGVYRIRAKVGDIEKKSWQRITFENVEAATYKLLPGEQKWTAEKVVRVSDHRLNIRIYIDPENNAVAGLSEIVFQQAY